MEKNINNTNQPETNTQKSSLTDKIGEGLEKVGHKISELGVPSVGQKIHDLGDKLEKTHDNPAHPHDV